MGTVCDVLLVGGGLANSLIALRLRQQRPELDIRLVEAELGLGAEKTWSVFRTDLDDETWSLLTPAFQATWPAYDVCFPSHDRRVSTGYASLGSAGLARLVRETLGDRVAAGRRVVEVAPDAVVCEDGQRIDAKVVIDGRGAGPSENLELGFQKFVGLELDVRRATALPCRS